MVQPTNDTPHRYLYWGNGDESMTSPADSDSRVETQSLKVGDQAIVRIRPTSVPVNQPARMSLWARPQTPPTSVSDTGGHIRSLSTSNGGRTTSMNGPEPTMKKAKSDGLMSKACTGLPASPMHATREANSKIHTQNGRAYAGSPVIDRIGHTGPGAAIGPRPVAAIQLRFAVDKAGQQIAVTLGAVHVFTPDFDVGRSISLALDPPPELAGEPVSLALPAGPGYGQLVHASHAYSQVQARVQILPHNDKRVLGTKPTVGGNSVHSKTETRAGRSVLRPSPMRLPPNGATLNSLRQSLFGRSSTNDYVNNSRPPKASSSAHLCDIQSRFKRSSRVYTHTFERNSTSVSAGDIDASLCINAKIREMIRNDLMINEVR